ncbi:aliphatic sulfonate ABC transporter substrate-binding protein [Corticimicrobacter populi]|uniref:Putative aliphatic sulfonates-binding protein n=1 Tax=Corticimicrobacter populi TaxID=2175229 RepID=A0A2V1K3J4_9BURK|nr:aliphatic sulfonate ABC transporter substrate-binding protein [Corticimicrobacter populi]PWF23923.1 sulfonate ABC transporter substrate-binding protein [Corticimicrobacter populi]
MSRTFHPGRRKSIKLISALAAWGGTAATASLAWAQQTQAREFRVGWQKGSNLAILKARGNLDERLAREGVTVRWIEFTAGPQMLEGLNVGSIDFACVGETPPVFAQAAGADLVYVANEPPAPRAEKVLVQKDSPIRAFSELKGRRIALNRGSNVHYLLLRLLEREGLQYSDVNVVYLPPADARAAFENGSIDAWIIWDPFAQAAIGQVDARVLESGEGLVHNYNFYLSTGKYANAHPEVLKWAIEEVKASDDWTLAHFDEAAEILAPQIGLSKDITRTALQNYGYGVQYLDDAVIRNQQAIADAFSGQKLIPRPLDVASVVWRP